ncbi:lytic transglycosylase domain-containing protein [Namhaeicola litoreus]|uniref:Lytic transglycosylase domain-containing protein n=1 Tax=Namhaeicola litoreus TaxID=1052145 RepID=A0ABW3Y338_9FLAO
MKNLYKIFALLGVLFIAFLFINADVLEINSDPGKNTSALYEIKALKVPTNLTFAGEKVPIEDEDVLERVDRELLVNTYWQSNGLLNFKRAHKYFPVIEPILKKYNIPDDFKYLALIESGLQNVTSPAGAKGYWQLMPKTAREYGLEVNENVDERYNLVKSTEAACQYLQEAYKIYGNWTLTAAAYNAGMAGISRVMDYQKVNSYYDLYLNAETSRYIPRIVVTKEIMSNPKKYGFVFEKSDLYNLTRTKTIEIDVEIPDLTEFASSHGITYKELKLNNPWLLEQNLNNKSRKKYFIEIPV